MPPNILSVHYTPMIDEVTYKQASELVDLEDVTESPVAASYQDLMVRKVVRVSVTYDI